MKRINSALAVLLIVCLLLATLAVLINSDFYIACRHDLNDNRVECEAQRKSEERKSTKECQTLLYRTIEDPVALYTGVLTLATIALFGVTGLLFAAAVLQGRDTKKAITESRRANEIAREVFEANQRPWLGFEHLGPSEIKLQANHLSFKMEVRVRNYGSSPATAVHFGCVMLRPESGTDVWQLLKQLVDAAIRSAERSQSNPTTVFPEQHQSLERYTNIVFNRKEIDSNSICLFADYFILLTYRHPMTGKVYCTGTGYGFMRDACPTYSSEGLLFDVQAWPVHVMPGCNFVG